MPISIDTQMFRYFSIVIAIFVAKVRISEKESKNNMRFLERENPICDVDLFATRPTADNVLWGGE